MVVWRRAAGCRECGRQWRGRGKRRLAKRSSYELVVESSIVGVVSTRNQLNLNSIQFISFPAHVTVYGDVAGLGAGKGAG